ncbi:16S rRNA (adenine(1518)-N(6)/adenine(1519)-N(6))-dimethyltransferase RsmA [Lactobacillus hominis]|uniref:Ribosomal RNA small subunit methyltransferase A n=1 Tax=Lactobacillus hominis DSM 23910 = CRBIP 24.179 TaxID=1423758 RepID=I7KGJ7_9LACO|nr:16S rRNA (adenine(1518)-N(6)/adenine(1519)-N(6))-dimethyltransferase RsmA [Lactobacillus hominis]KRM85272.1 dimethyladenosine transferase [Lactobacillus hominis DSM 23910 = CRBIP 24.179]MCT3347652.1 16S rRNA (adenine(1518)-N(6)/adenine(1519)-N(6))-dimethyltransferase RsmA [Lactobacillus hominis]CCI81315.1 Ribosomal RNA small subunit methyltransferase A [Lactobacillus hominis DSM 23910 = CRBIP 24.179]
MSNNIAIGSPVRTQAIINRYFMHAKKNLGQNFLVDLNTIKAIVQAADIQKDDQVIEIGPGIGSLTEQLLLAGAKVLAYEVDQDLPEILHNELPQTIGGQALDQRFKLVMKDVLKANFQEDAGNFLDLNNPVKIVANLPYYITTPIIFDLIKSDLNFVSLTLMMQKEVAQRLSAKPKTKAYGPLTLAVQSRMHVNFDLEVMHTSFMPQPKVDSAVVTLTPLTQKPDIDDYQFFDHVVKIAFAQRRKTLSNNLKTFISDKNEREQFITNLGLDLKVRPEELTLNQFVSLAKALKAR